jgi:membrane protein DedA with SNARE-associated domain
VEQHVLAWISQYSYLAIFVLLSLGIVGLPVPDETLLTFTGYLIYKSHLSPPMAFASALGGSASGITISYTLGRSFGVLHRFGRYVHVTPERLERAHQWFERIGHWALTFGYFIPGVRHLTAYAAGMSGLAPHSFAIFAYLGAVLWVGTFLSLGYFLGDRWQAVERNIHRHLMEMGIALGVILVGYLVWRSLLRRNRQKQNADREQQARD